MSAQALIGRNILGYAGSFRTLRTARLHRQRRCQAGQVSRSLGTAQVKWAAILSQMSLHRPATVRGSAGIAKESKDLPMSAQTRTRKDDPRTLKGRVALVTGGSRGAGRAIAAVLGEHGATVYVTGRSVRGQPTTDNLPGTIEETAEEVTGRGGEGIAVRCDHANELEVESLFRRIREDQGRLDILVNNAWGGYEGERLMPAYFWQAPLRLWDAMFERGLKAHLLATYFAIPLMIESAATRMKGSYVPGLIVSTVAW